MDFRVINGEACSVPSIDEACFIPPQILEGDPGQETFPLRHLEFVKDSFEIGVAETEYELTQIKDAGALSKNTELVFTLRSYLAVFQAALKDIESFNCAKNAVINAKVTIDLPPDNAG